MEGVEDIDVLMSMCVMDMLIPVRRFYRVISKETFRKFRAQGLKTYKLRGLGVCLRPTELKAFLDELSIVE